ncbi:sulfatase-like hydrolase/transferase [Legionella cincinnatiensis]|uniref:Sulfatase n=1 Tax=Legionella cincinnatiensis TaxID=28085 RepID=A0A378IEU0_9GAMM|nr:sulfatase-like hydrolase/transferase [Legionella cincinnatiensis]KTC91971.1 putative Sulfatase [Legionella cincinnatiensis]STX33727.1 putative Sulfatase [Legionella cincinnatiensis]
MKKTNAVFSYFTYFILFNLCFFVLQLALVYTNNSSFVNAIKLPAQIWIELITTFMIHLFLYILLSFIQTLLLIGILKRPWHYFTDQQWIIIIWVCTVCAILSANSYYFPLSIFSKLFSPPIPESFMLIVLSISVLGLSFLIINSILYRKSLYTLAVIAILPLILNLTHNQTTQPYASEKPNIILLGIDSLSPDSVTSESMPFFSKLVNQSTQFTDSISPLARTYPAWSSILTGLYAEHHHGEENLVAKDMVKSELSIAWMLKKQGYTTIYATDDRRFNNIDKEFGFEDVIGPRLGINDVILGTSNDLPLSNLLINFRISSWLFPYNYSNRASFFSYYPQTFTTKLKHDLASEVHTMPVFLGVHFTLPHWPYAWASSLPEQVNNEFSLEKRDILYQQALKKVDQQFESFFMYLQENHYLDNCLLIILSDHGEVLYHPNSRLTNYSNYQGTLPSKFAEYLKEKTATDLNKSAGHGSDILSPKQYHNVLAFRIYKNGQIITKDDKIDTRVALIDLSPTILDFLHLPNKQKMDGISLLPAVLNSSYILPKRTFFIESGIFPNQKLSKEKSIKIGHLFYMVNPETGELEIKPNKLQYFEEQKLYGIIKNNWVLVLYPDEKNYIPVIQNLSTGAWDDDLKSNFAKATPASQMYQQLHQFYGNKLFLPLP